MDCTARILDLKLRHPFGISRGTASEIPTVLLRLAGIGQGEGSPVRYFKQTAADVKAAVEKLCAGVTEENAADIDGHDARARAAGVPSAAAAALNIALWDGWGRRTGRPVYELAGAGRPTQQTTYTISLADNEVMEQRAREASHLPLLKIKLGRDEAQDLDAMQRIRRVAPSSNLRVDANAGWTLGTALSIIPKLAEMDVEFVEQPLEIGNLADLRALHHASPLPIFADEDVQDLDSLAPLRGCCSGINIKLMKCGGISEALRMIAFARNEGWQVMLGCMVETRLALGAGAHLAGLVDFVDLDAHMLTINDPFPPGSMATLSPNLPLAEGPGLGLDWLE